MTVIEDNEALQRLSKTLYGDNMSLRVVDPRELELLKKNARVLKKDVFQQLTANIVADKRLSSVPLCWNMPSGKLEVLSGNHRVQLEAHERENCPEHLRGLLCTNSAVQLAASISLLLDLREVWQAKNPWQERQVAHSRAAWDVLMERTVGKLEIYKTHIGDIDYQARDGFDLLAASDNAHTVFAFPPTYRAGYEKLEALLRSVVDWTPQKYKEMTDKSLELFEAIARFDAYYVVLEKELPEVYTILGKPSAILPRGRGRTTTIIAKAANKVVVRCNAKTAPIAPIWLPDAPVTGTETPGFTPISRAQSLRLNELYLARRIDYYEGGVDACLAFTLDGKVVGKADIIRTSQGQWKLPTDNPAGDTPFYIMCDLAVSSDVERRLAKPRVIVLHNTLFYYLLLYFRIITESC